MGVRNRVKRIRKLLYFSREAIKNFGFRYFVFLALTEFKKYKLDVFKPEPTVPSIADRTNDINYNNWRSYEKKRSESLRTIKFRKYPTFTIIISIDDKNWHLLDETLLSIKKQDYENMQICICHEGDKTDDIDVGDKYDVIKVNSLSDALKEADGEYVIFCNGGDVLADTALIKIIHEIDENPETELVYSDEDQINEKGIRGEPFFKPDWSPDLFLHSDYISNFFVTSSSLLKNCDISNYKRTKKYELLLQITEKTANIAHISSVLISIRNINNSENKKDLQENGVDVINKSLKRRNIAGSIESGFVHATFRVRFKVSKNPKVSVIIPTRDNVDLLQRCITSLKENTAYSNLEIIIINNNSEKKETLDYLASLPYKIIKYEEPFNFAKMNNAAASQAGGDFLLFMNDDVAALEPDWLLEMISLCQLDGVGAVGPKLVYDTGMIQHAGIAILKTGSGFHPMNGLDSRSAGYFGFLNTVRNCSAVTGACLLIKKNIFDEVDGFDEKFDLYYNDTDLCLKVWNHGYRVIYTPFAKLLHQGSSKIKEYATAFYTVENHYRFISKWPHLKNGDPFYNPNLGWDYKIEIQ